MKLPHVLVRRPRMLAIAGVVLLAGHGIMFYLLPHRALSSAVLIGVILLIMLKHLGFLGPLYALFRRGRRS